MSHLSRQPSGSRASPGPSINNSSSGSGGAATAPLATDLALDTNELSLDSAAVLLAQRHTSAEWYAKIGAQGGSVVSLSPPNLPVLQSSAGTVAIKQMWISKWEAMLEGKVPGGLAVPLLTDPHAAGVNPMALSGEDSRATHVFGIVNDALFGALRSGKGQAIVFRGKDAGSQVNLALPYMLDAARVGKKLDKFQRRVQAARTLIHAFGSTAQPTSVAGAPAAAVQQVPQFTEILELVLDPTSPAHRAAGFKFSPLNFNPTAAIHTSSVVVDEDLASAAFVPFRYLLMGVDAETRAALKLTPGYYAPRVLAGVAAGDALGRPDESRAFAEFTGAMQTLGVTRKQRDGVWRMLAAILHLSQLAFADGAERHGAHASDLRGAGAFVTSRTELENAAEVLAVDPDMLEAALCSEIKYIGRDRAAGMLSANEAADRLAHVGRYLYSILFASMVAICNKKLAPPPSPAAATAAAKKRDSTNGAAAAVVGGPTTFASVYLIQVPAPVTETASVQGLLNNYIFECMDRYLQHSLYDEPLEHAEAVGISAARKIDYSSNVDVFTLFDDRKAGMIPLLNQATANLAIAGTVNSATNTTGGADPHLAWLSTVVSKHANASTERGYQPRITALSPATATVQHAFGLATYHADGMVSANRKGMVTEDVVQIGRAAAIPAIAAMFRDDIVAPLLARPPPSSSSSGSVGASGTTTAIGASKKAGKRKSAAEVPTVGGALTVRLAGVLANLASATVRVVHAFAHAAVPTARGCESRFVRGQLVEANIIAQCELVRQPWLDLTVHMPADRFVKRFRLLATDPNVVVPQQQQQLSGGSDLDPVSFAQRCGFILGRDVHLSPDKTTVALTMRAWQRLESALAFFEHERKAAIRRARKLAKRQSSSGASLLSDLSDGGSEVDSDDGRSDTDDEEADERDFSRAGDTKKGSGLAEVAGAAQKLEKVEEVPATFQRRKWVAYTWLMTWWIPTSFLRGCGGMKRPDIQMAWREKLAICIGIGFLCVVQLFTIIGLGPVICPKQNIFNLDELWYKTEDLTALIAIYGQVYKLEQFVSFGSYHPANMMWAYAGLDVTAGFPRVPAHYCQYAADRQPRFPSFYNLATTIANGTTIQVRHQQVYTQDVYAAEKNIDQRLNTMGVANLAFSIDEVKGYSNPKLDNPKTMVIIGDNVYDLAPYRGALTDPTNDFLPTGVLDFIVANGGTDLSGNSKWMKIWNGDSKLRKCFNSLFIVGVVDQRTSPRCMVTNYAILGFSCVLVAVIFVKFLAALQFGSKPLPEALDKFVVLQVPCYTEDEGSLRKTIDSLATSKYDDKRKLLCVICDGNVIGSGNDRPTPRIVLDIFGVDPEVEAEPKPFFSLGENMKQLNFAKVYSGLYDCEGHLVPYIVIVKCGRPQETSKPGNRGKRDSQMILMRFFNKVYLDKPMSPLELEMFHHIKNVIGVPPEFYELLLQVDADTEIFKDSLTRLVASMVNDQQIMGCCGETRLANEKDTVMTMIQVYEYYISHHMAKAFESLFGSVTCLPGCFSIYRLRQPNKNTPVLVANPIIDEYGNCQVDTLHMKNLLHLGEDRYLTTLMLKTFPNMRTTFTADAICETIAPDRWHILLSQRRRWINSTIHNLVELLDIPELCGFCLFSMRFVVFIDLLATFLQPATVGYLGYLFYLVGYSLVRNDSAKFPTLSLILLAAMYGVQAIIFILKREYQHVIWMIIYILSIPIFSFAIPVYSFWHGDDFSWGVTRVVMGDNGTKQIISTETEKFDPKMIPVKKWAEYEKEMQVQHERFIDESDAMSVATTTAMTAGIGASGLIMDPMAISSPVLQSPTAYMSGAGAGRPITYAGTPMSSVLRASGGYAGISTGGVGGGAGGGGGNRPMSMPYMPIGPMSPSLTTGFITSPTLSEANSIGSLTSPGGIHRRSIGGGGLGGGGMRPQSSYAAIGAAEYTPLDRSIGGNGGLSEDMLLAGVRDILARSDLNTVTKKMVREQLEVMMGGLDLRAHRETINRLIAQVLASMQ